MGLQTQWSVVAWMSRSASSRAIPTSRVGSDHVIARATVPSRQAWGTSCATELRCGELNFSGL